MSEVVIDVDSIPTVESPSIWSRIILCFKLYPSIFIFLLIILIIGGATVGIVLANNKTVILPCIAYNTNTLASEVSLECIQYIWTIECPSKPYTIPSTYKGWWTQSPSGTAMIKCTSGMAPTQCGVGTYGNIITYMQFCNFFYNQY
jgi:hypothetical protein